MANSSKNPLQNPSQAAAGTPLSYIAFMSDTQYPWNACTDDQYCDQATYGFNKQCTGCTQVSHCTKNNDESERTIVSQLNSIADFGWSIGGPQKLSVMINGDITSYGHGDEWDKMTQPGNKGLLQAYFRQAGFPFYFGLGNHDYLNNLSDCASDGCVANSLERVYSSGSGGAQPFVPDKAYYDVWPSASNRHQGSFSFYVDLADDIRLIQLNGYPTAFPNSYVHLAKDYVLDTSNVISWLKDKLNTNRKVILCLHQPDDWQPQLSTVYNKNTPSDVQDAANTAFTNFISQYKDKILGVFAGHYHYSAGEYTNYSKNFGGIPVFLSGSVMYRSYLIAAVYSDRLEVYLVCDNDWGNKQLIKTIPFPPSIVQLEPQAVFCGESTTIWSASNNQIGIKAQFTPSTFVDITLYYQGQLAGTPNSSGIFSGNFDKIVATCSEGSEELTTSSSAATLTLSSNQSSSPASFDTLKDLEQITQQVHGLFTSSSHTDINPTVSSYQLDQILQKVNKLPSDIFSKERTALRKLLNTVKKFLRARNLLINGDFETSDGWLLGGTAKISDSYLLPHTHSLFFTPSDYPNEQAYAYQKIDESKLKPYTRYVVSGFINNSHQLELSVSRAGNELIKTLNVPFVEIPLVSSDSTIPYFDTTSEQSNPNFFRYSFDVGELQPESNPGIEVSLRTPISGAAEISHVAIMEERPLTEKEIQKNKQQTTKQKTAIEKEHIKTRNLLQPIISRIHSLFSNGNLRDILDSVTYQDVYDVALPPLQALPLRQWIREDNEGKPYLILSMLQEALTRVHTHLEEENLIHNGSFDAPFADGLKDWLVEGDAELLTLDTGERVLQLSNWDSSASQAVDILDFEEMKEYRLIVRAKGDGSITIENGEDTNVIVLPSSEDLYFYQSEPFSFDVASFVLRLQAEGPEFVVDYVAIMEIPETD